MKKNNMRETTYETTVVQRDTGKRYFKPVITPITFENIQVKDALELNEIPRTEHAIIEDIYVCIDGRKEPTVVNR